MDDPEVLSCRAFCGCPLGGWFVPNSKREGNNQCVHFLRFSDALREARKGKAVSK